MNPYWVLQVIIPMSRAEGAFGLADELERALGPRSGSGAGFGQRDIDWTFLAEDMAQEAKQKALAFFSERSIPTKNDPNAVHVDVLDYEDEDAA